MESDVDNTSFTITSAAFANNQSIPELYTCKGQSVRPPLVIQNSPEKTTSFAIIMIDPDAVQGEWTHWLAWNIDPATQTIDENSLPPGMVEGTTSFGTQGYGGPCPPKGTGVHRYIFEIYALDNRLDLPITTDSKQLQKAMEGHIIERARLTGSFEAE